MGGLFVLLPVLLLWLLLAEALDLVVALATPIADLFPEGTFGQIEFPVLIALILMVAVSFVIGLGMRAEAGQRIGGWFEHRVLERLPAYTALKSLTAGFKQAGRDGAFKPALLTSADGVQELAYVIEDHGNGRATVLVPWAPASFAGSVKIVRQERVEMLAATMGDASRVLSLWGVGVRDLMKTGKIAR